MTTMGERLPRIFQANLARLYERVIQPAMEGLVFHPVLDAARQARWTSF
jgi:hypothetical protein